MAMNRRNVLVGLGAVAVGGGAAFGSGAFSQVEAERTLSVTTTGDADALLAFSVDTTYNGVQQPNDTTTDVVRFNFGGGTNGINQNARTTFNAVITVTNNGNNDVSLSVTGVPDALTFEASGTDLSTSSATVTSGTSVDIDVEIDLINNSPPSSDQTVTFDAA